MLAEHTVSESCPLSVKWRVCYMISPDILWLVIMLHWKLTLHDPLKASTLHALTSI